MKAANDIRRSTGAKLLTFILVLLLVLMPLTQQMAYANASLPLNNSYLDNQSKQVLKGQIVWADFTSGSGNATAINVDSLIGGKLGLNVGSILTIDVTSNYQVKVEVLKLQPFDASDEYKNRVIAAGNDPNDPTYGYRPGATNTSQGMNQLRRVVITKQDATWSNIAKSGFDTGENLNSFTSEFVDANVGVTFKITATYNGVPVKPNIVMADSEEAGTKEGQLFVTRGAADPWELIANVAQDGFTTPPKVIEESDLTQIASKGYFVEYWGSPDQINGGLGSSVFGPVATRQTTYGVPIVMSRNAEEISLYFNTIGNQSAMLGFIIIDEGDAPESYGNATHMIRTTNGIKQPFIGSEKADLDAKELQSGADWLRDDVSNNADEGAVQLMGADAHQNSDGSYTYTLHRAESDTYKLKILADPNSNAQSYVKGWVDFNRNGKFDDNESSQVVVVNAAGQTELVFSNVHQDLDNSVAEIGMRIRTAVIEENISEPTGNAFSGEVEDFKIHVTYPPRGEKETTTGLQGKAQSAKVDFTAYGKRDYDFNVDNEMDDSVAVKIVKSDGTLVDSYTETNEGTYTVAADGTVTFTPVPTFVGTAKGVVLRAVDKNGVDTGWISNEGQSGIANINNGVNGKTTMDGVYIPKVTAVTPSGDDVTSSGVQGVTQSKKVTFTPGDPSVAMDDNVPATFADGTTEKAR